MSDLTDWVAPERTIVDVELMPNQMLRIEFDCGHVMHINTFRNWQQALKLPVKGVCTQCPPVRIAKNFHQPTER